MSCHVGTDAKEVSVSSKSIGGDEGEGKGGGSGGEGGEEGPGCSTWRRLFSWSQEGDDGPSLPESDSSTAAVAGEEFAAC